MSAIPRAKDAPDVRENKSENCVYYCFIHFICIYIRTILYVHCTMYIRTHAVLHFGSCIARFKTLDNQIR